MIFPFDSSTTGDAFLNLMHTGLGSFGRSFRLALTSAVLNFKFEIIRKNSARIAFLSIQPADCFFGGRGGGRVEDSS